MQLIPSRIQIHFVPMVYVMQSPDEVLAEIWKLPRQNVPALAAPGVPSQISIRAFTWFWTIDINIYLLQQFLLTI